jgi:hypothetical protein
LQAFHQQSPACLSDSIFLKGQASMPLMASAPFRVSEFF